MKQYQHLSNEERFYIHQAVREGKLKKGIAHVLGRHPSTIGQERKHVVRTCLLPLSSAASPSRLTATG